MTKEELQKIKEHIEMRARIEPYATEIRQILWKAVKELEATKELKEENKQAKEIISECLPALKRGSWWELHDKAEQFLKE